MKLSEIRRLLRPVDQETVAEPDGEGSVASFGLGVVPTLGLNEVDEIEVVGIDLWTWGDNLVGMLGQLSPVLKRMGWDVSLVGLEKDRDILKTRDEYGLRLEPGGPVVLARHPYGGVIEFDIPRKPSTAIPLTITVTTSTSADLELIKTEAKRAMVGASFGFKEGETIRLTTPPHAFGLSEHIHGPGVFDIMPAMPTTPPEHFWPSGRFGLLAETLPPKDDYWRTIPLSAFETINTLRDALKPHIIAMGHDFDELSVKDYGGRYHGEYEAQVKTHLIRFEWVGLSIRARVLPVTYIDLGAPASPEEIQKLALQTLHYSYAWGMTIGLKEVGGPGEGSFRITDSGEGFGACHDVFCKLGESGSFSFSASHSERARIIVRMAE